MIPNIEYIETIVMEEGIMIAKMKRKDLVGEFYYTLIGIASYVSKTSHDIENFELWDEDVPMKYFIQSLTKDVRDWYRSLPNAIIDSKDSFFQIFKEQYGDQTDLRFRSSDFNNIKKGHNEMATEFNVRFQKEMYKFPRFLRPNERACLVVYSHAYYWKMSYLLRDKNPQSLREAYNMTTNIENNRRASSKLEEGMILSL